MLQWLVVDLPSSEDVHFFSKLGSHAAIHAGLCLLIILYRSLADFADRGRSGTLRLHVQVELSYPSAAAPAAPDHTYLG